MLEAPQYGNSWRNLRKIDLLSTTAVRWPLNSKACLFFADDDGDMNRLVDSATPEMDACIAAERRQQQRVSLCAPVRIVAINGKPASYNAVCRNVSHGAISLETATTLQVGKIIEFELIQMVDQPCRYYSCILYRHGDTYGAYYVNDDGSDIRPQN